MSSLVNVDVELHGLPAAVMDVNAIRSVFSKRRLGFDSVFAVLNALTKWGGARVEAGKVKIDASEFFTFLQVLTNRVIDQDACDHLKQAMNVDLVPDQRQVPFTIPVGMTDNARIAATREEVAVLNFRHRMDAVQREKQAALSRDRRVAKRRRLEYEQEQERKRVRLELVRMEERDEALRMVVVTGHRNTVS